MNTQDDGTWQELTPKQMAKPLRDRQGDGQGQNEIEPHQRGDNQKAPSLIGITQHTIQPVRDTALGCRPIALPLSSIPPRHRMKPLYFVVTGQSPAGYYPVHDTSPRCRCACVTDRSN